MDATELASVALWRDPFHLIRKSNITLFKSRFKIGDLTLLTFKSDLPILSSLRSWSLLMSISMAPK